MMVPLDQTMLPMRTGKNNILEKNVDEEDPTVKEPAAMRQRFTVTETSDEWEFPEELKDYVRKTMLKFIPEN